MVVGLDLNAPPDCSAAVPSIDSIWPVNHKFRMVQVLGVIDPEGDPFKLRVTSIYQDEPVDSTGDGRSAPDGRIRSSRALVRAERDGGGNGRVYYITFSATADNAQGSCTNTVQVSVPHNKGDTAVGDGPLYDSTVY